MDSPKSHKRRCPVHSNRKKGDTENEETTLAVCGVGRRAKRSNTSGKMVEAGRFWAFQAQREQVTLQWC
jgi:hypothetical protein